MYGAWEGDMDIQFEKYTYHGYTYEVGRLSNLFCWRVGSFTSDFSYDEAVMHEHAKDYINKVYFGGR